MHGSKKNQIKIYLISLRVFSTSVPTPVNFTLFCSHNTNAFGGTAKLVHNSISYTQPQLTPEFEAIAILVNSKTEFTPISTYISPNKQFRTNNLQNVFSPTNLPTIVIGDFNSWHPYWGSPRANSRTLFPNS